MPIVGINSTPNIPGGVGIRPLSKYWTHEQIASEAMVLTNTIDNVSTTSVFNISPVIEYSTPEESAIELLKSKGYIITKQF